MITEKTVDLRQKSNTVATIKKGEQLRVRTPSTYGEEIFEFKYSLMEQKYYSIGREYSDFVFGIKENFPSNTDFVFVGQMRTKFGQMLSVYLVPETKLRTSEQILTVINPSDIDVIFLPSGFLEIITTDSIGFTCPTVEMMPQSRFNLELIRREILPADCNIERLSIDPFPVKRWYPEKTQNHFYYRIQPEDIKNIDLSGDICCGPNIIIGQKKVKTFVLTNKSQKENIEKLKKDDPNRIRNYSNNYGILGDFYSVQRLRSAAKILIDTESYKIVEIPNEFECTQTDLSKNKLWKANVFFATEQAKHDVQVEVKELQPRVMNTTYFQRILIKSNCKDNKEKDLCKLRLERFDSFRYFDILNTGLPSNQKPLTLKLFDKTELQTVPKEKDKKPVRICEVKINLIPNGKKLLDGCNTIVIGSKMPKAKNTVTCYNPPQNNTITISPGDELCIRLIKEQHTNNNGTTEWNDWYCISHPQFLMKASTNPENNTSVFKFYSFLCYFEQDPGEITFVCWSDNKKKERKVKVVINK